MYPQCADINIFTRCEICNQQHNGYIINYLLIFIWAFSEMLLHITIIWNNIFYYICIDSMISLIEIICSTLI